ncbi:MAG: rRNA maturation RNase YbeY [Treponema sp.]|nr:rRNA maturation RNase YbeY [Treponema sp.]
MANRILVSMYEGMEPPAWFDNLEDFARTALNALGYDGEEISILLCNDEYIRQLNNSYRGIDSPTDVLSFENDEEYDDEEGHWKCAGDIAISLDMLPVNARYFEVDSDSELKRLLVHGILHLNGLDHGEEHIEKGIEPSCEMLKIQEEVLLKLKDEKIIK